MSGVMVGSGLGGLGGWIAEQHSWGHSFSIFGLVGIGYTIVVALLMRDAPRERADDQQGKETTTLTSIGLWEAFRSLFSRSSYILALLYWGLLGLAGWAVLGWMPTYLNEHFNLTQGRAGLISTGFTQGALLCGVLLGGWWADRWYRKDPNGRIYVPLIGMIVAAPGVVLAAHASVLPLAVTGIVIYGLTRAFADCNMMPILCQVTDPRYRATGYGILNLCSTLVGGATIYLGGALRDAQVNVNLIFYFAAFAMLGCAGLLWLIKPRQPRT